MTESFITLRGLDFCLARWGPEAAPGALRVLALHGWLDQAPSFEPALIGLSERGVPCYALDQRGHGRSAWAPRGSYYHFPDYVADVDALWRLWGCPPLVLVGHSMGGTVASLFAGARPEAVRQLVLIEGLGPPAAPDTEAPDVLRAHLTQLADPPRHKPVDDLDAAVARLKSFTPRLPPALARRLAERCTEPHPSGGLSWAWDPLHRTRAPVAYDVDRHVEILGRIKCEALSILGSRSWYPSIPGLARREAAIARLERLSLDAGHAVHIDAAEAVGAAIAERWRRAAAGPVERTAVGPAEAR